jgi:hypothetical protein
MGREERNVGQRASGNAARVRRFLPPGYAKSADVVRASYKAAIDAGATSIKESSLRPEWRADYFAANIGDPDGHNIEIAYKPWLYK